MGGSLSPLCNSLFFSLPGGPVLQTLVSSRARLAAEVAPQLSLSVCKEPRFPLLLKGERALPCPSPRRRRQPLGRIRRTAVPAKPSSCRHRRGSRATVPFSLGVGRADAFPPASP